ncbi:hypothetical protein MKY48_03160 [Paenibacillus sp. FSL W8-0187]|uniref:hypothetical protein n=1 Tax=unclassified Paenibacillus TaxID=185978 RepID=UPI0030D863B4
MYKIVAQFSGLSGPYFDQKRHFSNGSGHEVRYSPNKALIFRLIPYLTERVSDRSGKNEPIAKITDLLSDTATAGRAVTRSGLRLGSYGKLTVHYSAWKLRQTYGALHGLEATVQTYGALRLRLHQSHASRAWFRKPAGVGLVPRRAWFRGRVRLGGRA